MISIDQIHEDISDGKSTKIYFSAKSLWWTHLESDLTEASKHGFSYQIRVKKGTGASFICPSDCDPIGNKTKTFPNAALWLKRSLSNPAFFGKHGLKAFLKTHHQNCTNYFSNTWQGYNNLIDRELHG